MRLPFQSIRSKLALWFLVITLAPLAVMLMVSARLSDENAERSAMLSIAAIAQGKAEQLDAYARERLRNVASVATGLAFVGAAEELSSTYSADGTRDVAAYDAVLAKYQPRIDNFATVCEFKSFAIIDARGRLVYSTVETPRLHRTMSDAMLAGSALARALPAVSTKRTALITPPELARDGVRPAIEVVGPLFKNDAIAGFVAVTLDAAEIDRIVGDGLGLGSTGEIVCACFIGKELVLTTPTRTDPDAAFSRRVKLGSSSMRRLQETVYGSPFRGRGDDSQGDECVGAWARVPSMGWAVGATMHVEEVFAAAKWQQEATLMVAAIAVIPVMLLALVVARQVTRPVRAAAAAAQNMSVGDLSHTIAVQGSGELRVLLDSMRHASSSLIALLQRVKTSGAALSETAHEIRASANEQGELAQQFGTSSVQISAAVREITESQRELNESMQSVAGSVRVTTTAASDGRGALAQLEREITTLKLGAASMSQRLTAIRERADNIVVVVASVAKVANQTNLLSVNAAMEAERAGEAGAGFRAVAREIRRLSSETADATLRIEAIVDEMQTAVSDGVNDMTQYTLSVDSGVSTVGTLGAQLGAVIGGVEKLGNEIDLVARGMDAQALGVTQVSQAVTALSDGAARTAATGVRFVRASSELESRAQEFSAEVAAFKLPTPSA